MMQHEKFCPKKKHWHSYISVSGIWFFWEPWLWTLRITLLVDYFNSLSFIYLFIYFYFYLIFSTSCSWFLIILIYFIWILKNLQFCRRLFAWLLGFYFKNYSSILYRNRFFEFENPCYIIQNNSLIFFCVRTNICMYIQELPWEPPVILCHS